MLLSAAVLFGFEAVADPGLGFEGTGADRIGLDFMAELMYGDADKLGGDGFTPNFLNKLFLTDDPPGIPDKNCEKVILNGRKMNFLLF